VVVVLLKFLRGGILSEEQLGEASEVMDGARWKGVESVGDCPFRVEGNIRHMMELFLAWITILS